MRTTVLLATVAGLLAVPSLASAQEWLKDRKYTEGPGFRFGDFELHPGAALEFGYDSNYERLSNNPNAALRLRITPSLYFSTLGAQRTADAPSPSQPSVIFRGGLSATYNEFIPIGTQTGPSIENERNIGGHADLGLQILPGRAWSGNLNASYDRVLTASTEGAASSFNSGGTLNRDVAGAGAELAFAPGAGLLEWRLGYQFTGTFFEDSGFSDLNGLANQVELKGKWRFLPRTSLIFDGKFGFNEFGNSGGSYEKFDSHPVRTLLGVNGLITPSFAVLAMVGWGASFYQLPSGLNPTTVPVQDFDSVIGQAEVRWFVTPAIGNDPGAASAFQSSVGLGFTRDFVDSYIGSTYFERDRGYLNVSYLYGGRFLLVLDGGAGPIVYPTLYPTAGGVGPNAAAVVQGFTDIRIDASVFAEYRFKDYFGLNATFRYNQNIDPANVVIVGQQLLAFTEIEAYLGVRWLM